MSSDAEFQTAVAGVVAMARQQFGEPKYTYHKKTVRWSSRDKSHFIPIDDGPEVTREEYEANAAKSKSDRMEAFMGRLKREYLLYHRKQIAPAWREKLLALVPNYPE